MRKLAPLIVALAVILRLMVVRGDDYPAMNLRLGHTYAPTTIQSQIDQWFVDEIDKRSGGKIKIRIFWSEMLGKNTEMLDLIGNGAIELGIIVPSFFPTRLPLSGITNALPLAFDSAKTGSDHPNRTRRRDSRDPRGVSPQQGLAAVQSRFRSVPSSMREACKHPSGSQKSTNSELRRAGTKALGRVWGSWSHGIASGNL